MRSATPPIPRERKTRLGRGSSAAHFGGSPAFMPTPFRQNDQISHGNTYREERVSAVFCASASRGLSVNNSCPYVKIRSQI